MHERMILDNLLKQCKFSLTGTDTETGQTFDEDVMCGELPLPSGRFRMYRFECYNCGQNGVKEKFYDALVSYCMHQIETGHTNIDIRGGNFLLEERGFP